MSARIPRSRVSCRSQASNQRGRTGSSAPRGRSRDSGRTIVVSGHRAIGPNARSIARSAANPRYVNPLARAGLVARGVMYVIIGWIAVQIAFGHSGHQADQSGATRLVASTPVGTAALWLLVAGFAGLTLWRLS